METGQGPLLARGPYIAHLSEYNTVLVSVWCVFALCVCSGCVHSVYSAHTHTDTRVRALGTTFLSPPLRWTRCRLSSKVTRFHRVLSVCVTFFKELGG